jgi:hypothetical protein
MNAVSHLMVAHVLQDVGTLIPPVALGLPPLPSVLDKGPVVVNLPPLEPGQKARSDAVTALAAGAIGVSAGEWEVGCMHMPHHNT